VAHVQARRGSQPAGHGVHAEVRYIVYQKMKEVPANLETEDFVSAAFLALFRSLDRYDPQNGASLEQFAWTRIQGAVLDELRRCDWAPRSLRKTEWEIAHPRERLLNEHQRHPTTAELAVELDVSPEQLTPARGDLDRATVGSLNTIVALEDDDTPVERIDALVSEDRDSDPIFRAMRSEASELLREAFIQLPERDRQVALMLYVHNLSV
jgi:RNA polymerase sigma factor for flagellar operon FliA